MILPVFLGDSSCPPLNELELGAVGSLNGAEARHAIGSQRLDVWDILDLVDGKGLRLRCKITASGKDCFDFQVQQRLHLPLPQTQFGLIQALPKEDVTSRQ